MHIVLRTKEFMGLFLSCPPKLLFLSIRVTFAPEDAADMAADKPAGHPPIIAISVVFILIHPFLFEFLRPFPLLIPLHIF